MAVSASNLSVLTRFSHRLNFQTPRVPDVESIDDNNDDDRQRTNRSNRITDFEKNKNKSIQNLAEKNYLNSKLMMFMRNNALEPQLSSVYRAKIVRAIQAQKIFTVYDEKSVIRTDLLKRGWIEKCPPNYLQHLQNLPLAKLLIYAKPGNDYSVIAITKLVEEYPINFIWNKPKFLIDYQYTTKIPYVNHMIRGKCNFTTKAGLIECIENSDWNGNGNFAIPRYHLLSAKSDHSKFLQDYRITHCLCLVRFIAEHGTTNDAVFHRNGQVSLCVVKFATSKIYNEIKNIIKLNTNSGDNNTELPTYDNDFDDINCAWESFYLTVTRIVNGIQKIRYKHDMQVRNCLIECKVLLEKSRQHWPRIDSDGFHNLWIVKPSNSNRGRGICIYRSYDEIIANINRRPNWTFVVQKYIEKPLLIHKTKFDLRQYMLITITNQFLYLWIYRDCYFRFSSEKYNLSELDQSIHITNHTVQKQYKNNWHHTLPANKMWSLEEFKKYLVTINANKRIWDDKIFVAMKRILLNIVATSLEDTDLTENTFELFGCDFMLTEDFAPILIEINSNPDMSYTTDVTAKICSATLQDTLKCVLDYPKSFKTIKNCKFELIHKFDLQKIEHVKNHKIAMDIKKQKLDFIEEHEEKLYSLLRES